MIKHSLTITEATQRCTKQNRDTINKVAQSLNATLKHHQTISREVKSILKYEEVYVEFDRAISGISETIGIARSRSSTIYSFTIEYVVSRTFVTVGYSTSRFTSIINEYSKTFTY